MKTIILTTLLLTSPAFAGESPLDLAKKCLDTFGPNQTLEQTHLCTKLGTSTIVEPPKATPSPTCDNLAGKLDCDADMDCQEKLNAAAENAGIDCSDFDGNEPKELPESFYECEVY